MAVEPLLRPRQRGRPAAGAGPAAACWLLALLLAAWPPAAHGDTRTVLSGLVGRGKAEVIGRLGPPSDTVTTVDGERLLYETLDTGRVGGRSGQDTRAGGTGGGVFSRGYSFRCRTEVVIRDGRVTAFNRSGNDCR